MNFVHLQLSNIPSLPYYLPELTLAATILLLLIVDLVVRPSKRFRLLGLLALLGSAFALLSVCQNFAVGHVYLFERMVVIDPLSNFLKVLILLAVLFIIPISYQDSETNRFNQGEYLALILSLALGACILTSSNNLLMIYLSLELVSLTSYVLAGYLKKDRRSSEASLKYVIYGGAASGAMIYGMSFLYGLTGSMDLGFIAQSLSQMESSVALTATLFSASLLCLVGLGYKIAAVPFHMWCPDVYEGSPTPITAYFSVVPKIAGFGILIRFFYGALAHPAEGHLYFVPLQNVEWPFLIAAISCATMTLGNLVAIHQNSLKRLLAYSSIAHAGYMLMAFVVLNAQAISAILFYLTVYVVMNLGAFLVVILVKEATGSDHIDRFRGLGWRGGWASFLAVCMTIFLFSLTGLPPTAGFIGKVYLFGAVIQDHWYWLAVIGVLNSVISLYYYARIVKAMFFDKDQPGADEEVYSQSRLLRLEPVYSFFLILFVLLTLLLGVYWSPLIETTMNSVTFLSHL